MAYCYRVHQGKHEWGWTWVAIRFLESCPPLIVKICLFSNFYDEFAGNYLLSLSDFSKAEPSLAKIC